MSEIDTGNTAWVMASTALVFIMTPGLGFFYAGMAGKRNVLSILMSTLLSMAVVSVQWFVWGYSLSFSTSGDRFIGDLKWAGLDGVATGEPHPAAASIPHVVFMMFQCMFACITPAIAFGGAVERTRLIPYCVFLFAWSTVVYDVIAYWTWGPDGWIRDMGGLDYAGGTPVHIASGFAGFTFAYFIGARKKQAPAHNITYVILGTSLLWFGWLGFNGGSAVGANARAGNAILVSNLTAAWSGVVWTIVEYIETKKISAVGFCNGALAGLVCVTPASGFIEAPACLAFGFVSGTMCYLMTKFKKLVKVDDAMDTLAVHGMGGFLGNILTGVFSTKAIIELDGVCTDTDDLPTCQSPGWVDDNYIQVPIQIAGSVASAGWAVVVTYIILFVMDKIPGLELRFTESEEEKGGDLAELGEIGYDIFDNVLGHVCSESPGATPLVKRDSESTGSLTRAELHHYSTEQLSAWLHGLGLSSAAAKAKHDGLVGADILEASTSQSAQYFGDSYGAIATAVATLRH